MADELEQMSNADLLATLDTVLVEVERRLLRYARTGPEILAMADEGLVLVTTPAGATTSGSRIRRDNERRN